MRRVKFIAIVLGAALVLTACAQGAAEITVEDEWGRTSPKVAAHGAFYMTITGGETDDTLVAGSSDACEVIELHDVVMTDDVMKMIHLPEGIDIPAGEEVSLEVGGLHVMCLNKQIEFTEGTTLDLTLDFEEADSMTVEVEIRDE